MKQVYGVFIGTKWGVTTSKKEARAAVAAAGEGEVRRMPWGQYTDTGCSYGWDAPTFALLSDPLTEEPNHEA